MARRVINAGGHHGAWMSSATRGVFDERCSGRGDDVATADDQLGHHQYTARGSHDQPTVGGLEIRRAIAAPAQSPDPRVTRTPVEALSTPGAVPNAVLLV